MIGLYSGIDSSNFSKFAVIVLWKLILIIFLFVVFYKNNMILFFHDIWIPVIQMEIENNDYQMP